jgi:hypothetical protein
MHQIVAGISLVEIESSTVIQLAIQSLNLVEPLLKNVKRKQHELTFTALDNMTVWEWIRVHLKPIPIWGVQINRSITDRCVKKASIKAINSALNNQSNDYESMIKRIKDLLRMTRHNNTVWISAIDLRILHCENGLQEREYFHTHYPDYRGHD